MLGAAIVLTLLGGAALVVALIVLRRGIELSREADDIMVVPAEERLEYDVPPGQDPTVVLLALKRAGYHVAPANSPHHHAVEILCPSGADRERDKVRAVIGQTRSTAGGGSSRVRFTDEP
jgi:hypothetical protein